MTRPLIGLTSYWEEHTRWRGWTLPTALLPAGYAEHTQRAGGVAALLPPDDPARAGETVRRLDGLVVCGGPDVAPDRYGAASTPTSGPLAPRRDAWELALIDAALDLDLPLLGVCRGMQVLNVALGGTLFQHLPDVVGNEDHGGVPGAFGSHPVDVLPGTRLDRLMPGRSAVPTHHHQAVDRVGEGLTVCARAADGTVEAVELDGARFTLGVQWHPEMGDDPRLFSALVGVAGGTAQPPRAAASTPGASTSDGPYQVR
ncbi:glutamine amidotransferase [Wenjunlia vitaminophila]|uniref:Glutamine amidotransferase n=1 Tax=Wenjunlia vitaminophila TaxID=76728 RepID=A0A0T6LW97_WENVI|nr:gamma-glutamyl-gamma-aminobutyrate hydrolase family protein [Wenjunlia vitaminophila]KRV50280.1 glutamine amidotransferase [Wenjunlia vitaminophila]